MTTTRVPGPMTVARHDDGTPPKSGMHATARVATELRTSNGGPPRSQVSVLSSQAPLNLRITRPKRPEPWAAARPHVPRVCLTAGAAGPVGGDQLTLHVDIGAGSALVLAEVSATLVLPGPHGHQSRTINHIRVAPGGTLIWLPEPVIAARGCDHLVEVRVDLDVGARLLMREELLLGRHGEPCGRLRQRSRVRLGGRPLYRQDLDLGTRGSDSPAVVGHNRAVGSLLVVDPAWQDRSAQLLSGRAAVLPLAGPAVVVSAVADDSLELRRQLEAGLALLGPPWAPLPVPVG